MEDLSNYDIWLANEPDEFTPEYDSIIDEYEIYNDMKLIQEDFNNV